MTSVFGLRGLSVGHRSMPEMNLNLSEAKKQTQKTLMLLCSVCKPRKAVSEVEKGRRERRGRQIKDPK